MSGTSVDGVDVAIVEIEGNWIDTKIKLIGFMEYPYPPGLKEVILGNSVKESSNVYDISQLNFLIPKIYSEAVFELLTKLNMSADEIDLIGSHGQTIHHVPEPVEIFGKRISSTLQIGDPSVLAKLTGVTTVGNFRTADMALKGQGAPLVPYFDYLLFHSNDLNRGLLNIGGISNITLLKKGCTQEDVLAFDTGPGNMLIDSLVQRFFGKPFDEDGKITASGSVNEDLLNALIIKDNFIEKDPPKSTGREYYGEIFYLSLLDDFADVKKEDWIATVTEFTAYAVYRNYEKFIRDEAVLDELLISGGGANNKELTKKIHDRFGADVDVKVIDEIGVSADAKEAICFAVLANETISGNTANIPRTTGASKATILGQICLP
jgi:anhydro-N-acetylmuramic acid kinase